MTEINYAKTYNAEFSRLNPGVPMNAKWDPIQQMNYLKQLLARQQARGGTGYLIPYVNQVTPQPATPITPAIIPAIPAHANGSLVEALASARNVVRQLEALIQ